MNSREKGKRGERQWRDELRPNGYAAWRGQQFSGSAESPDVVCPALRWIHFEVKAVERLNIEEAMRQARADCRRLQAGDGRREGEEKAEGERPKAEGRKRQFPSPYPLPRGEGKEPMVAHRRRFGEWLVTMGSGTLFKLLRGDFATGPGGLPPSGGPGGLPPSGGPSGLPPSGGPSGLPPSEGAGVRRPSGVDERGGRELSEFQI